MATLNYSKRLVTATTGNRKKVVCQCYWLIFFRFFVTAMGSLLGPVGVCSCSWEELSKMSSDLWRTLTDCSVELRELFSHVVDVSPSLSTESPDSDKQTVDDFYTVPCTVYMDLLALRSSHVSCVMWTTSPLILKVLANSVAEL